MEQIDQALNVQKIIDLITASPLELGVKAGLILIAVLGLWWIKRQLKKAMIEAAQEDREESYIKDEQKTAEENEADNTQLVKDQEKVDDWAEEMKKKKEAKKNE